MTNDWKHMTDKANEPDNSGFAICVICIILGIAATLIFHEEIWLYIDWMLTIEENFHG